jgi:hypothetical protein
MASGTDPGRRFVVRAGSESQPCEDWPALAAALDHLAACPDLVTLLTK